MGRYRKVDPKIWNDDKFRLFSDNGKLVFLFCLTHPHMTSLGAMRATIPGLAAELQWKEKAFAEAFAEACSKGMIIHDEKACFLSLPNFLKFNPPESSNVVKSWREQWDQIPECSSKDQLYHNVKAFLKGLHKDFLEAYTSRVPSPDARPSPYPEPEPEPEFTPIVPKGTSGAKVENGYCRLFDDWWKVYPRQEAKAKAYVAWKKAGAAIKGARKVDSQEAAAWLLERTRVYAASPRATQSDPEKIPHPTTWLNQGRYDDADAAWQTALTDQKRPAPKEPTGAALPFFSEEDK